MTAVEGKRREERFKLLATFFSNLGVGSAVAGVIAPLAGGRADTGALALATGVALVLHLTGQAVLHYVVTANLTEAV